MRKRLEFVGGSSAKFWEIDVSGARHTVRFGRLGTDGQSKVKAFADAVAAKVDADKLVAEKLKKGYRAAKSAPAGRAAPATAKAAAKPRAPVQTRTAKAQTRAAKVHTKAVAAAPTGTAASAAAVARVIAGAAGKTPLAKLESLELELPRGATLEPLLACKALRDLTIRGGALPDLAPLARLPRLTELTLFRGTSAQSLAGLAAAASIKKLTLGAAKVPPTLLAGLAMPKLEQLIVYGRIGAPRYLAGLTGLQSLTLRANTARSDLADLAPLASLRELRHLDITGAPVRSLRPLAGLRLRGIHLAGCSALRSLEGLERSTGLTYVDASYSKVEDLSALGGMRDLEELNLRGAPVKDLSPILGATSLQRLYVEKTKVTSLAGLDRMRKLEILWAWDIRVTDLTMLQGLPLLRMLDIPTLKSPSWDFLGTLKSLEHLDLMMTNVPANIAGLLLGLPKLTKVRLAKTAVPRDHKDAKKLDAILRKRKGGVSFDASRRWSWTM
ncbi:MAG: WGR domain-containing protein [Deltaproteobacteria bacterium]|nr:WGR domain-containing protein [Deltaproteobacteria bacterium]